MGDCHSCIESQSNSEPPQGKFFSRIAANPELLASYSERMEHKAAQLSYEKHTDCVSQSHETWLSA